MLRFFVVVLCVSAFNAASFAADAARPRKIVLIAGRKSHGPGVHEYEKSVRLLKAMLDTAPNIDDVRTEIHFNGWPEDERTLDDADTIMIISDGQDGDKYSPVPFMTPARMAVMERQMRRGCGFVTFHFSTFTPDRYGSKILEWGGGYFDWQDEAGQRNWYSAIKTTTARVELGVPAHPVSRGLAPLDLREEFYCRDRRPPHGWAGRVVGISLSCRRSRTTRWLFSTGIKTCGFERAALMSRGKSFVATTIRESNCLTISRNGCSLRA